MNSRMMRSAGGQAAIRFTTVCALMALMLSACSGGTGSGIVEGRGGSTRAVPGNALLMQVRAAGTVGNELDVQPLRDPQVEDLRATATKAENAGDYAGAQRALAQALVLSPDDPDLLQWQAEMSLASRDWAKALQYANRSFERGPKLGGLCRRNWMTIRLASDAKGDPAAAAQAQLRVASCIVAPPTRM